MFSALTVKQQRFINEYMVDLNATQAAIRAGYSPKSARKIGSENLSKPDIQIELTHRIKERKKRSNMDAQAVIDELVGIVEVSRQKIPVLGPEGKILYHKTLDPQALIRACELIGKHLGMWGKTKALQPHARGRLEIVKSKRV